MNLKSLSIVNEDQKLKIYINSDDKIYLQVEDTSDFEGQLIQWIVLDKDDAIALRKELSKLIREI